MEPLIQSLITGKRVVILTGAGISAASGLPTFRDPAHLQAVQDTYGVTLETLLSYSFFYQHPEAFWAYFRQYLGLHAEPNAAHQACVDLESLGYEVTIVTQNIDGLHEAAGSSRVLALHGDLLHFYCSSCETWYDGTEPEFEADVPTCLTCQSNPRGQGLIRPNLVFYQEELPESPYWDAVQAIKEADVLIIAGTSLQVYPVAGLWQFFNGTCLALFNEGPTPLDNFVTVKELGKLEQSLPKLIQDLTFVLNSH